MKRLAEWIDGLWNRKQCCHAAKREPIEDGHFTAFCVRYKGHFGKHKNGCGDSYT